MKLKHAKPQGFTLIELLVVMTIIAVLATVGFTAFGKARETANRTAALSNLKQIHLALSGYAADNNDAFSDDKGQDTAAASTSNQAFRKLMPNYINDEKAFAVRGTKSADADGDMEGEAKLAAGENHWAMAKGLRATSNGNYPLVWENSEKDDGYDPEWKKGYREEWGGSWSDGSILLVTVSGGAQQKKLALKEDASAGEKAGIQKEGKSADDLFSLRRKGSGTDVAGLPVEKGQ